MEPENTINEDENSATNQVKVQTFNRQENFPSNRKCRYSNTLELEEKIKNTEKAIQALKRHRDKGTGINKIMGRNKRKFKPIIGLLQLMIMWYKISKIMLEGKLIIIPALGHQNKGKSSFTGSGLFVLMSQWGNNNELVLQRGWFCTTWSLADKSLLALSERMGMVWRTTLLNFQTCWTISFQQLVKS